MATYGEKWVLIVVMTTPFWLLFTACQQPSQPANTTPPVAASQALRGVVEAVHELEGGQVELLLLNDLGEQERHVLTCEAGRFSIGEYHRIKLSHGGAWVEEIQLGED